MALLLRQTIPHYLRHCQPWISSLVGVAGRFGRFWGRVRLLLILENAGYLAQNALFLLLILSRSAILWRLDLLSAQAKYFRKDTVDAGALVAGVGRFGANDKCRGVGLRTGWSCQQVGELVELHIYDAGGL